MDNINTTKGEEIKEREQMADEQVKEFDETIKKATEWKNYEVVDFSTDDDRETFKNDYSNLLNNYKNLKRLKEFYKNLGITKKEQIKEVEKIKEFENAENNLKISISKTNNSLNRILNNRKIIGKEQQQSKESEEYDELINSYTTDKLENIKNEKLKKYFFEYTDKFNKDYKKLNIDELKEKIIESIKYFISLIDADYETENERNELKNEFLNYVQNYHLFKIKERVNKDYKIIKKGILKSEKTEEEKKQELKKLFYETDEKQEEYKESFKQIFIKFKKNINKKKFDNLSEINEQTKDNKELLIDLVLKRKNINKHSFKTNLLKFDNIKELEFLPTTINIIAGRPSTGKTTLLINLFLEILKQNKNNVVFMTTELKEIDLITLMIKKEVRESIKNTMSYKDDNNKDYSSEELQQLFNNDFDDNIEHYKRMLKGEVKKDVRDEIINSVKEFLTSQLIEKIENNKIIDLNKFKGDYKNFLNYLECCDPYTVIFLDYIQDLQLLRETDNKGADIKNSYERLEFTLKDIEEIAKNNNLIIILGSQFNRDTDKDINLNNLAKSGKLEQVATIVIGLNQYENTDKETNETKNYYLYKLLKNRYGYLNKKEYFIDNEELKYCLYYPTTQTTINEENETESLNVAKRFFERFK